MTNEYLGWDNYVKEKQFGARCEPSYGWNIPYSGPENEPNRVNQLQERVKKLELKVYKSDNPHSPFDPQTLVDKVGWLEEFRHTYMGIIHALENKVKDLEEWKRGIDDYFKNFNQVKIIDKKVWEEIKRHVMEMGIHNQEYKYYIFLNEDIKKAEGDKD
jgi:hypothetical protein